MYTKEIEDINKKIEILKIQKRLLEENNQNDRKKRTRRLIQKGALVEKYFDIEHLSVEETEEVFKIFSEYFKSHLPSKYKQREDK